MAASNTEIVSNDSDSSECDEPMQLSEAQKAKFRIHGCPKSGRTWKDKAERKFVLKLISAFISVYRTSSIKKDVAFNSSWSKKMQERQQMKNVKALQAELRDNKKNVIEVLCLSSLTFIFCRIRSVVARSRKNDVPRIRRNQKLYKS
jgi:hypothetical protein